MLITNCNVVFQAKKKPNNFLYPEFNNSLLFELGPLANVITPPSRVEKCSIIKKQDVKDSLAAARDFSLERSDDIKEMLHPNRSPMVKMNEPILDPAVCCRPLSEFLEEEPCVIDGTSAPPLLRKLNNQDVEFEAEGERSQSQEGTSQVAILTTRWEPYKVPSAVTERWGDCFGILLRSVSIMSFSCVKDNAEFSFEKGFTVLFYSLKLMTRYSEHEALNFPNRHCDQGLEKMLLFHQELWKICQGHGLLPSNSGTLTTLDCLLVLMSQLKKLAGFVVLRNNFGICVTLNRVILKLHGTFCWELVL